MMNAASRIDDETGLKLADDFRTTFRGLDCKPHRRVGHRELGRLDRESA